MANNPFHDHLDRCKRCRDQPFNLCMVGAMALKQSLDDYSISVAHAQVSSASSPALTTVLPELVRKIGGTNG